MDGEPEGGVCPVSEVAARPVSWLVAGRLALGKLALLEGDPGLGKSLLSLDLCARLSRGLPFPDGGQVLGPCNSIVLNGEDGAADTIRPRLESLGADVGRVFVPAEQSALARLRLPSRVEWLEREVERTEARLVVIDPLLAFLDGNVSIYNDQSVRQALGPLAEMAERRGCVPLMHRHLNKGGGRQAIYRGGGSIGLVGLCRSAWLVGQDPVDAGRCVLAQVKNNLAPRQPSLAYSVTRREVGPPELSWLGTSNWSADGLVAGRARGGPRARAREFLLGLLQAGPRPVREVWAEGQKQGLAVRTLKRARQELAIRSVRCDAKGGHQNYWLLAGQELPAGLAGAGGPAGLEEWLGPLQREFPDATPLDEE